MLLNRKSILDGVSSIVPNDVKVISFPYLLFAATSSRTSTIGDDEAVTIRYASSSGVLLKSPASKTGTGSCQSQDAWYSSMTESNSLALFLLDTMPASSKCVERTITGWLLLTSLNIPIVTMRIEEASHPLEGLSGVSLSHYEITALVGIAHSPLE